MAKYTIRLQTIIEGLSGSMFPSGISGIDSMIETARPYFFNFSYPWLDKATLEHNILYSNYMKEIGFETPALFIYHLRRVMSGIMPKYFELQNIQREILQNKYSINIVRELKRATTDKDKMTSKTKAETDTEETQENIGTIKDKNVINQSGENVDVFSNTPQGSLENLREHKYMTDARIINKNDNSTNEGEQDTKNIGKGVGKSKLENLGEALADKRGTEKLTETTKGNSGMHPAEVLGLWRKNILPIENMILAELDSLFMGIY